MYTMIIIDDEDLVIESLMSIVEWDKHMINVVGTATNGQTGMNMILNKNPDIVLTDIRMPGLNGLELIAESKKHLPDTIFIIISGHAEFNYAKSAIELEVIDYLIKPIEIDSIINVIKKAIHQREQKNNVLLRGEQIKKYRIALVEKYFLDLLLGIKVNNVELKQEYSSFAVFCIGHKDKNWASKFNLNAAKERMRHILDDSNFQAFPYLIDEKVIIIIAHINQSFDNIKLAEKINILIQKEMSILPTIGIGNIYSEELDIYNSYKESQKAFQTGLYLDKDIVHFSEFLNMNKNLPSNYIKETEVFFRTKKVNYQLSCQLIDILIDDAIKERLSSSTLRKIGYEFLNQLEGFFKEEYGIDIKYFFKEKYSLYEQLDNLICINETREFLKRIVKLFFDHVEKNRVSPKEKLILDVKKYLEDNYENAINLDEIAKNFYISSSYLSSLFSEFVGLTISDYLLKLRMNRAKELLRTTNLKVDKISKLVGYENYRYFSQVFKKNVKTTPSLYRLQRLIKR
ncbi:response regulator [Bacillus sp. FJAT-50079]|uniref:response regulator n=1 Tax=Bacillus sp. FJAT-50079 TaxID=2833577 RepID=UPI001BCA5469|nr:response regulator [Bacillus sp. FJAT-50079]MBS4206582.1 response regulator [Bacillus sp. FJAT-50079]